MSHKNTVEHIKSKIIYPDIPGACHWWSGYKVGMGYGMVRYDGRDIMAHRFLWELEKGPIPDGLQIDHLCNNPACVNIEHMRLATPRENSLAPQSRSLARAYADRECCPKCGGPFFIQKDGNKVRRRCRACMNERQNTAQRRRWAADSLMRDKQRQRRADAKAVLAVPAAPTSALS